MSRRQDIREELARLGIAPRKSFGQNFLFDPGGIAKVLETAGDIAGKAILEIGPGLGAISRPLAEAARCYVAVEIDAQFADRLSGVLGDLPQARVIQSDVRDVRLPEVNPEILDWHVVSNVPYSVSSDVVLWLLDGAARISRATLLFQREFAERIAAAPGGKEYGSLSVQTQLVADVSLGPRIHGRSFYPETSVESRLISLKFLPQPRYPLADSELFRAIVRAGFGKRRKTILNALCSAGLLATKAEAEELLRSAGIDPARRAETLDGAEFVTLANALAAHRSAVSS